MLLTRLLTFTRQMALWLRATIELLILLTIVFGIIAFVVRWSDVLVDPQLLLSSLRGVMEDLLTLVLLVELRELFRRVSPLGLLDIVATILARELVLTKTFADTVVGALAIAVIVLVRGVWTKWFMKKDDGQ